MTDSTADGPLGEVTDHAADAPPGGAARPTTGTADTAAGRTATGGAWESEVTDIVAGVLATAARMPSAVAMIDGRGRRITFGELRRRVLAVRRAVGDLDSGDGVLFAVRPGPDAAALALGAVAAGGMLVLADPGLAPGVLAGRIAAVAPRRVVAESLLYLLSGPLRSLARRRGLTLPDLADPLPGRPVRHLYTGPWLPGVPRGARRVGTGTGTGPDDDLGDGLGRTAVPGDGADPDRPAVVVFTSGTTAEPKGVVHTRGSLAAGVRLLREAVPFEPGDVVHTDQLMLGLPALLAGATWSLPGSGRLADELAARAATHAFCVPVRLHRALAEAPRLPDRLRCLLLGTAPAPPAVLTRALEAAPRAQVLSVYALTEALPVAVASAQEKLAHPHGDLLGAPLPGVGVRLADDGELLVSGPHLAARYLGGPPLTEVATGDLARIDAQGRLMLLGRKKDMLLRDGFNIYPGLYEPAIAALPGVAEAAVVGLADPHTGDEEVVLALVPAAGFDLDLIQRSLPDLMDAPALPDRIEVLDALPRSGRADKVDREKLRERVRK